MPERRSPDPSWADPRLVSRCLKGDETAWNALVDKYKNFVYAVILRQGVDGDEAADVFQAVWLDACNDLPKLRRKAAFKSWLVSLAAHKCYHWRQQQQRLRRHDAGVAAQDLEDELAIEPAFAEELERDQLIREAIYALPPRCREMIRLLFFTFPPKPYQEVAERLGLATGSIGFIRRRCLQRLQKTLARHGLD